MAQANDGRTLYTASSDGTIFAWDLSGTRRFGRAFTAGSGNETPLWGLNPWFAISPDGKTVAVTQADGYVNLWSLATLRQIETFRAVPDGPVITVNFSPDGKLLAVTGTQGQFLLWDLTASPPTSRRLTGLPHTSGRPSARLPDGSWYEALTYASFSPDGRTIAAGDWQQISFSTGEGEVGSTTAGDLAIWDVRSGDLVRGPIRLGAAMTQVIFNPDGGMLAVTLGDGHVLLINAHTLKVIRTLAADTVAPPTYFDAFSPDGRNGVRHPQRAVEPRNRGRRGACCRDRGHHVPAPGIDPPDVVRLDRGHGRTLIGAAHHHHHSRRPRHERRRH